MFSLQKRKSNKNLYMSAGWQMSDMNRWLNAMAKIEKHKMAKF